MPDFLHRDKTAAREEAEAQEGVQERDAKRSRIARDREVGARFWQRDREAHDEELGGSSEDGLLATRNDSHAWALLMAQDEEERRARQAEQPEAQSGDDQMLSLDEALTGVPEAPPVPHETPVIAPWQRTRARAEAPQAPHMPESDGDIKFGANMTQAQLREARGTQELRSPEMDHDSEGSATNPLNDQMANQMRVLAARERRDRRAELDELGTGRERADRYRGANDQDRDMRAMVDDPRFQDEYAMRRDADSKNVAHRYVAGKVDGLKHWWKSDDRAMQAGKYAGRKALAKVPIVNSTVNVVSAKREHDRMKIAGEIAADPNNDRLMGALAGGLAGGHKQQRNREIVNAVTATAKTTASAVTMGAAELIPGEVPMLDEAASGTSTAVSEAAGVVMAGGKEGLKKGAAGGRKLKANQERPQAIAPGTTIHGREGVIDKKTDAANEHAYGLAANDHMFGNAMLTHLNADYQEIGSVHGALAEGRRVDPRSAKVNKKKSHGFLGMYGSNEVRYENNLKPSQIARMQSGERARQNEIDRSRDAIWNLSHNEQTSWYEQGSGRGVRLPESGGVQHSADLAAEQERREDEEETA